jgi:hypothetical protein
VFSGALPDLPVVRPLKGAVLPLRGVAHRHTHRCCGERKNNSTMALRILRIYRPPSSIGILDTAQSAARRDDTGLARPAQRLLYLSDYASVLLFIWRFVWGLYERAHIVRYFPPVAFYMTRASLVQPSAWTTLSLEIIPHH